MPARTKKQQLTSTWYTGAQSQPVQFPTHDRDIPMVELRYVVTPDLDGRQLQYRSRLVGYFGPHKWGPWLPVLTVFTHKKLKEKTHDTARTRRKAPRRPALRV